MFVQKQGKKSVPRVVIVGGGFAGIATIQSLQRTGVSCEIILVTKNDSFEYYPTLYKLVTGALAIEASIPYQKIKGLNKIVLEKGTFISTTLERQSILVRGEQGEEKEIVYDYLVLALGSETNYRGIVGLSDLSFSFKSVKEAFRLKKHFCDLFGVAMTLSQKDAVAKLHIIIVGAGPSGVELAGDLTDYLHDLAKSFNVEPSLVAVDLIEVASRILPTLPERIAQKAEKRLRTLGVNIYTNRAVTAQDINEVSVGNMNFQSNTVIWTAGNKINSAYQNIPEIVFDEKGRVVVDKNLALPQDNHVFVVGDGAGTRHSGLAQTADHNGKYLGKHIANTILGKHSPSYKPASDVSFVIPIGNRWALFLHRGFVFRGLLPWLLRSLVDFRYFISIMPLKYVIEIFRQGAKYRRSKTYCPME